MTPLVAHCRELGLQALEVASRRGSPVPVVSSPNVPPAFTHRDRDPVPAYFLKVGTGHSTRCLSPEAGNRLAYWRRAGQSAIYQTDPVDVATDPLATTIEHPFGSPSGDRTPLRSPQTVSAADEGAVSTRQLQPPSSFTAALEPDPEPIQGQLFDLDENSQP